MTVYPGQAPISPARVDAEWVAYEREEADRLLEEARGLVGKDIEVVSPVRTARPLVSTAMAHPVSIDSPPK